METGEVWSPVRHDPIFKLSVPPGFVSRTAFTLRRMAPGEDAGGSTTIRSEPDSTPVSSHVFSSLDDDALEADLKIKCKPWILHDHIEQNNISNINEDEKELDVGQSHEVSARWDPSGSCSTRLEEAPVFRPTHEEFKDTLKYVESIYQQVKPYGFCRIIPPPSWQSPCFLGENNAWKSFEFTTQVQRISESQKYFSKRKGLASGDAKMSKRRRILEMNFDDDSGDKHVTNHDVDGFLGMEQLQVQLGPRHTLESFKKNANCFKECYFSLKSKPINPEGDPIKSHEHQEPSEEDVEGEYWRISEKPTAEIEVLCGDNIDARELRSKFPELFEAEEASTSGSYQDSGWNLNNISNLPGSLFVSEELDYSSNLAPQFHLGMCFSSRPWEIERRHFCTLYYLHLGAPKIWYGAPGHLFQECKTVVEKLLSAKLNQCSKLPHEQVMQISPANMLAEGIPVHRCVQQPKEFVLFLPGAYHAGFDCGFNISESASFALLDWLSYGQTAAEVYRSKRLKTLLSHDRFLLRAAHEAVKANWEILLGKKKTPSNLTWKGRCGKGGVIAQTLRVRVESEARQRQYLTSDSQCRKMVKSFDEGAVKECYICHFHLYISASFCACDPNRYACLRHTKHLCSCAWGVKVFLFRFNIDELNLLSDAVEGKFSACHKWVRDGYGRALDMSQEHKGETGSASNLVSSKNDSSSSDNASEHKGETRSSSDLRSDLKKKLVSESMARILQSTLLRGDKSTSLSTSDDSSSESEDVYLSSLIKKVKSFPSETHSASSMRASAQVICISSSSSSSDDEA